MSGEINRKVQAGAKAAFEQQTGLDWDSATPEVKNMWCSLVCTALSAARLEALEEAAIAAEGAVSWHKSEKWRCDGDALNPAQIWHEDTAYHAGRSDAAAAIRALKDKP